MPTYEYRCNDCGTIFEIIHSIKETPSFQCQECDAKEPLERLISQNIGGFIFKGHKTEAMNWKEKRVRYKKNAELEVKQIEKWSGTNGKLVPNIGGTPFDNWRDAAVAAKESKLDPTGFQKKAEEAKHINAFGIDDRKWKAAKKKRDEA